MHAVVCGYIQSQEDKANYTTLPDQNRNDEAEKRDEDNAPT